MKPEDYRKVVKFCDKGKCKVRENSFGVWQLGFEGCERISGRRTSSAGSSSRFA